MSNEFELLKTLHAIVVELFGIGTLLSFVFVMQWCKWLWPKFPLFRRRAPWRWSE
jgi:hypothetical protein